MTVVYKWLVEFMSLWDKIKKYDIVSFDIFDTLIKRNVPTPSNVFDIVEKKYNEMYENVLTDFKKIRIEAEKLARDSSKKEEVTIGDIYNYMSLRAEEKERLIKLEIQVELNICLPNQHIKSIYKKCIKYQKKVILASDMYLPGEVVEKILRKCGYSDYSGLYLSSEVGLRKRTGNLFKFIKEKEKVSTKSIIHIGDSYVADVIMPLKYGISAQHLNRYIVNTEIINKEDIYGRESNILCFANNSILKYKRETTAFCWGYETLGPLIIGFSKWVHEQAKNIGIEKLFFLSRDMFFVIQAYKEMFHDIDCSYLEISRKSLRIAYIKKRKNLFAVYDTMSHIDYTLNDIIHELGLKFDIIAEKCRKEGLIINPGYSFSERDKTKPENVRIASVLYESVLEIHDQAEEYLLQEGLYCNSKIAVVDIGWHGSIQNMLQGILNKNIIGLYFGNIKSKKIEGYAYWFNASNEYDAQMYLSMRYILECMLFPEVGTVITYRNESSRIFPVYAKIENDSEIVSEFQKGAVAFFSDFIRYSDYIMDYNDKEAYVVGYYKLATEPTLNIVKTLGCIHHEDGNISDLVVMNKMGDILKNPIYLIKSYIGSRWTIGYIKYIFPFLKHPQKLEIAINRIVYKTYIIRKYLKDKKN